MIEDRLPVFTDFPPSDLMRDLVELYFRNINDVIPLLHEPTFKQAIETQLHLRRGGFGATLLLVCANGARFTDDPRVILDGSTLRQSAGWKWFEQVERALKPPLAPVEIYDVQVYTVLCISLSNVHIADILLFQLMTNFLQGTSAPQASWSLIGTGLRMAIDVGAHRKEMYSEKPKIEEELWRRAFW